MVTYFTLRCTKTVLYQISRREKVGFFPHKDLEILRLLGGNFMWKLLKRVEKIIVYINKCVPMLVCSKMIYVYLCCILSTVHIHVSLIGLVQSHNTETKKFKGSGSILLNYLFFYLFFIFFDMIIEGSSDKKWEMILQCQGLQKGFEVGRNMYKDHNYKKVQRNLRWRQRV